MEKMKTEKDWSNHINCAGDNVTVKPLKLERNVQSFREAFGKYAKEVLNEQKKVKRNDGTTGNRYYDSFSPTTNGEVIINPKFTIENGKLDVDAEIGLYESYHAYNGLKNGFGDTSIDFKNSINYKVLSAGVIMFHKDSHSFYLFKRPEDSQEAPGQIDLLGGCMNTKDGVVDGKVIPEQYVLSRMKTKAGVSADIGKLHFLGVQEFEQRGFYNLVYFYELDDTELGEIENNGSLARVAGDDIDKDKEQDNPGGSALSLALEYLKSKNK